VSSPPDEGWSRPSFYTARGRSVEPRTFTEDDPISAVLVADWSGDSQHAAWGATNYVGPRRRLPKQAPLAATATPEPAAAAPDREPAAAAPEPSPDEDGSERGLIATTRAMAIASLASRVTGFLRNSLLVAALGVHGVGNAYNLANNFPNMVYELLLGGVLSSVLVPLLVHAQEDDADAGVAYTQRLMSIATAALGILTLVSVVCAPLLAAGFVQDHAQRSLTSILASLLLPEIFFYGIGAMFMAVLNVRHSYAPGAWSPVLNNVVMIATVVAFWLLPGPHTLTPTSMTTAQILVLGIGTTLGIAAQALVLVPALRRTGFHWKWRFRAYPNEVGRMHEVGTLAMWVLGYVVASQIGVTVIAKVGVGHDAFTIFTNADLLIQMPYGILVVSLLTALMPRLSRAAARERRDEVVADLGLGARLSAVALVPIIAGLLVLGQSLTVVLFAYGRTSVADARLIGTALAASAFGLFPFALVMLQLRVFYAMRDARTPTLINVFMVGTKVALVLGSTVLFSAPAKIAVALTTSTSASYLIGAVVGHVLLTRRLGGLHFGGVLSTFGRVALASCVGAAAALAVSEGVGALIGHGRAGSAAILLLGGLVGAAVLAVVLWRMRIPEITDLMGMVRRRSAGQESAAP
jgi:putative peptidoglycan lipid II flippase